MANVLSLEGPGFPASREMFFLQGEVADFCLAPRVSVGARVMVVGTGGAVLGEATTGPDGKFTLWRRDVAFVTGDASLRVENGASLSIPRELLEDPERSGYARMVRRCPNQQDSRHAALMPEATLVLE